MSLSLVITLIRSLLHFLFALLVRVGTLKMPIPLRLLELEQPNITQFSPGISRKAISIKTKRQLRKTTGKR